MVRTAPSTSGRAPAPLQVQVLGPDVTPEGTSEVRRLLATHAPSCVRRDRLAHATCVVARCGARAAGVAAYERTGSDLRVLDMVLDPPAPLRREDVAAELLHALETAALAGGCSRVVLLPPAVVAASALEPLGYRLVAAELAGGWLEKQLI